MESQLKNDGIVFQIVVTRTLSFLTVGQNNFGNKIPFELQVQKPFLFLQKGFNPILYFKLIIQLMHVTYNGVA